MKKIIKCDCGYIVKGNDVDELVANAQRHASEAHGVQLTREQALALAEPQPG